MLKGNSSFAGNLDIQLAQPVDGRQICAKINDLCSLDSWKASDGNIYLWKGMQTYVQDTGEWYELVTEPTAENIQNINSWKKVKTLVINDTTPLDETTYSSNKIKDLINTIELTPGPQGIGFIPCSWGTYQDLAENIKVTINGTEYGFLEKFPAFSSSKFSNWLNNTYNWGNHDSDVCIYASDYYPYLTSTDPTNYPDDYMEYVEEAMIECAEKFVELYNAVPVAPWGDYPSITETGVWWGGNLFGKGGPSVLATNDSIGGFKTGYSENGKNYPVELSEGKAYVNVPWEENTAHSHSAGTGLSIGTDTGGTDGTVTISLNTATTTSLGGIKIGYSENGKNYPVELSEGKAYVNVPWEENTAHEHTAGTGLSIGTDTGGTGGTVTISLNAATTTSLGGIKVGYSNNDKNYGISLDSNESAYVNVPWLNTAHSHSGGTGLSVVGPTGGTSGTVTISLNAATTTSLGGIKVGYSGSGQNYAVSLENDNAYVNVPWKNTAHEHTAGTGLSIGTDTGGTDGTVTISLNTASSSSLGGIKVGDNLNIDTDGKLTAKGYTWSGSTNTMTITSTSQVPGKINSAGGFFETSDARKKDVQGELPLDKAYDFIRNCEPILYNLKGSDKTQIGLIAQEVKEFFPEIVNEDEEGYLSLDYAKLTVIILRVLKDLIDKK